MLIDSHCHLPHSYEEAARVIASANESGVVGFINVGTSINDSLDALAISQKFDGVFSSSAVYPHDELDKSISELRTNLISLLDKKSSKLVAVGECGIDISESLGGRNVLEQMDVFEMQIKLALDYDLPLIIHNRNGDDQVMQLLKKYKSKNLRGIAHCFASSWETAKEYLDLNFYISFSGLITYPARRVLKETVINVPEDKFVVETDSPYLPPQGYRGQTNEPKYVKIIAQKVAEMRNSPFEEISKLSFDNTCRIFNLNI